MTRQIPAWHASDAETYELLRARARAASAELVTHGGDAEQTLREHVADFRGAVLRVDGFDRTAMDDLIAAPEYRLLRRGPVTR